MLPDPSFQREFLRREFTFYTRLFSLPTGHIDLTAMSRRFTLAVSCSILTSKMFTQTDLYFLGQNVSLYMYLVRRVLKWKN